MTRDAPWFKMFVRDWLEATRGLDPDVRGIYIDCLCIMYDRDGPIPDDDGWMAHQLHVSRRKWRAARDALVGCGKLVSTPDGLVNKRAVAEIGIRSKRRSINAENGAKNSRNFAYNSKNRNDNNKMVERDGEPNSPYAHARQNLRKTETETIFSNGVFDDDMRGVVSGPRGIPRMWRAADLEWLQGAVPQRSLDGPRGLIIWLWQLEAQFGASAVSEALRAVRKYVESGGVPNVIAYVAKSVENHAGQHRGAVTAAFPSNGRLAS